MPFKIREARKASGFTQEELAKRAKVSRATIIGLENGSITVTTTETLTKIAGALNKKVSEIFLERLSSELDIYIYLLPFEGGEEDEQQQKAPRS